MPDSDLMFRPASELAGMVRAGEVSSRELVEISLARIEELNPQLNAFVEVDAERALAVADEVGSGDERPFAGVPIAIKNNRAVKGMRLTERLLADGRPRGRLRPQRHAAPAARPGFVIVGTTTLPEYGILPVSEARMFGPTRNPWDLERTPGGSSGGAAAAVASRDGAGRARQRRRRLDPDSRGVLRAGRPEARARAHLGGPRAGGLPAEWSTACSRARSPTRRRSSTCSPGYEPGDATWAPPPAEPFALSAAAASRPRQAADRGHDAAADRRRRASTPSARVRSRGRRDCCARSGTRSRRSIRRGRSRG